jgi:hypothetical protein
MSQLNPMRKGLRSWAVISGALALSTAATTILTQVPRYSRSIDLDTHVRSPALEAMLLQDMSSSHSCLGLRGNRASAWRVDEILYPTFQEKCTVGLKGSREFSSSHSMECEIMMKHVSTHGLRGGHASASELSSQESESGGGGMGGGGGLEGSCTEVQKNKEESEPRRNYRPRLSRTIDIHP